MPRRSEALRAKRLLALAALPLGCGGVLEMGVSSELSQLYAEGECARLLQRADETYSFIADRPDLLAQATWFKASCLASMGRDDEAIALFHYLDDTWPSSLYAAQARGRLRTLEPDVEAR